MNKVNLFLVGSPKCATTSLANLLHLSDDVFVPRIKEVNYFNKHNSYYNAIKTKSEEKYHELYRNSRCNYWLDASVSYFIDSSAIDRIYTYNRDAIIIICVRHPLDRALSHYNMDKRMGLVKESFESAIQNEQYYSQYIENSRYEIHIRKWQEKFENVYILNSLNFEKDFEKLCRELEIEMPEINPRDIVSNSGGYSYKFGVNKLVRNRRLMEFLKLFLGIKLSSNLKKFLITKKTGNQPIYNGDNLEESISYYYDLFS